MGLDEPGTGKPDDSQGTGLRAIKVLARNTGVCVEDSLDGIGLNLGCGRVRWPGWVNIDSKGSDLDCDLRSIPLPSGYASVICAIHVIEHFYQWEAKEVLLEWKRLLKPGGKLVLELPCMNKILGYIHSCVQNNIKMAPLMLELPLWGDPKHKDPAWCHKWGYTKESMIQLLEECGFKAEAKSSRYHFKERDMRIEAIKC